MALTWTAENTVFGEKVYLTDEFEKRATPDGMRCKLFPHQQVTLKAMQELEDKKYIRISKKFRNFPTVLETSAGVLSNNFGSGKTIEILSLIAARRIPICHPCRYPSDEVWNKPVTTNLVKNCNIVSPNIIIVGNSVLYQWHNTIKTMTNLEVFVVDSHAAFKILVEMIEKYRNKLSNDLCKYDIILVKNSKIVKGIIPNIPTFFNSINTINIANALGFVSKGLYWARVILDDYDTIKLPVNLHGISSLFVWFISATHKKAHPAKVRQQYEDAGYKKQHMRVYMNIFNDPILTTNFNVSCSNKYIDSSVNIPKAKFYIYTYKSPNDIYVDLLEQFGNVDEIVEMINGDAFSTAAEVLGINTTSVADVFQKILGTNLEKFIFYCSRANFIESLEIGEGKYNYTTEELAKIRENIKKMKPVVIMGTSNELKLMLKSVHRSTEEHIAKYGGMINRVKSNLEEGDCPVCCLPLDDEDINAVIMKCCGIVICDKCISDGSNLNKTNLTTTCLNCKREINMHKDLISVDVSTISLDELVEKKSQEIVEEITAVEKNAKMITEMTSQDKLPQLSSCKKLAAIIQIIKGDDIERQEYFENKNAMIIGKEYIEQTDQHKKTIIFCGFSETLKNIVVELKKFNISYAILQGTPKQLYDVVEDFQTNKEVLLVNSSQHCAGINLQFATDVIFYHKIFNTETEEQISGRAQRIGRTCSLNVHYLVYEHEVSRY